MIGKDDDHESRASLESRDASVATPPASARPHQPGDTPTPGTPDQADPPVADRQRSITRIGSFRRGARATLVVGLIGGLVLAGCAVLGWSLFFHNTDSPAQPPATRAEDFVTYHDEAGHFTISYPRTWTRAAGDSGTLVLAIGGQNALSVRRFPLQQEVKPTDVDDMRSVTDAILSTPSAHLTVLADQPVTVNGLTGLYYLYYFPNEGGQGVHAHYFLFQGQALFTMVFQVVPAADFQKFADTFDAVAKSFQVDTK
jgi:hypothetical protein